MSSFLFLVTPTLSPKYLQAGCREAMSMHSRGQRGGVLGPGGSWLGRAGLHSASQAHPEVRLSPRPGDPLRDSSVVPSCQCRHTASPDSGHCPPQPTFWLGSCLGSQVPRNDAPTCQAPTLPPPAQVRHLFHRNESQPRAGQGLAQGHQAGLSGRAGLTAGRSAARSTWSNGRRVLPWTQDNSGPGRLMSPAPGSRLRQPRPPVSVLKRLMWPFEGVLTDPQEGSAECYSFLPSSGNSVPRHSIREQHLLGETKHLPSTCHQTVTLGLCQGALAASSSLRHRVSQGLLSHWPLQGRTLPLTPPAWGSLGKSPRPLPSLPNSNNSVNRAQGAFVVCSPAQSLAHRDA